MTDFAVGIDLGTSTSEICLYRKNGSLELVPDGTCPSKSAVIPSVVALGRDGVIKFGENAKKMTDTRREGAVAEVKRLLGTDQKVKLGDRTFAPEEISAAILGFLKERAEDHLGAGAKITEVVITVPANFNDLQRGATRRAGELAGLEVLALVNEPTAAARAFAHHHVDVEGRLLVFDFGGGTLDVTIIDMYEGVAQVVSTFGDTELGGKEFDDVLGELIKKRFEEQNPGVSIGARGLRELKLKIEQVKLELSQDESAYMDVPFFGQMDGKPIDLDLELTRAEFDEASKHLVDRAKACLDKALEAKGVEISSITQVILVGGTTYLPSVRKMVGHVFGRIPASVVSPDLAVAMGAAVHAAELTNMLEQESSPLFIDVTSHGLGTDIAYDGDPTLYYDPLIGPNTPVPHTVEREYQLMSTNSTRLRIKLFESHDGDARLCDDAREISEGIIEDIPPSRTGVPHVVRIRFTYNTDGLVELHASIPAIGRSCRIEYRAADATSAGNSEGVAYLQQRAR